MGLGPLNFRAEKEGFTPYAMVQNCDNSKVLCKAYWFQWPEQLYLLGKLFKK